MKNKMKRASVTSGTIENDKTFNQNSRKGRKNGKEKKILRNNVQLFLKFGEKYEPTIQVHRMSG